MNPKNNQQYENSLLFRVNNIINEHNISDANKEKLRNHLTNINNFISFANKYEKINIYKKQVKKEFLLNYVNNIHNQQISDKFNVKHFSDIQNNISSFKDNTDIISNILDVKSILSETRTVTDTLGSISSEVKNVITPIMKTIEAPFSDGTGFIRSGFINYFEIKNAKELQNELLKIESYGHQEINSMVKSYNDNEKLFKNYVKDFHEQEDNFIHKIFPRNQPITDTDFSNKKNLVLKELMKYQEIYSLLHPINQEVAFVSDIKDLTKMMDNSISELKLDPTKELTRQITTDSKDFKSSEKFKILHNRFGAEIIKNVLEDNYSNFNRSHIIKETNQDNFINRLNKNHNDHLKHIQGLYFSVTETDINNSFKLFPKTDITFKSISNTLSTAKNHINQLLNSVASDPQNLKLNSSDIEINNAFNKNNQQLHHIQKIASNIEELEKGLRGFNIGNKDYKNISIVTELLDGNLGFKLPSKLLHYPINVDKVPFYQKMNETLSLIQDLAIKPDLMLNKEHQVESLFLAKSSLEYFRVNNRFDQGILKSMNRVANNNFGESKQSFDYFKNYLASKGKHLNLLNNHNAPTENNIVGGLTNLLSVFLKIKKTVANVAPLKILDQTTDIFNKIKHYVLDEDKNFSLQDKFNAVISDKKDLAQIIENKVEDNYNTFLRNKIDAEKNAAKAINNGQPVGNEALKTPEPFNVEKVKANVAKFLKDNYSDKQLTEDVKNHINRKRTI